MNTLSALADFIASMRFAISLLGLLVIALMIGSLAPLGEPYGTAGSGPFQASLFGHLGSFYSSPVFLTLLALLLASTLLCLLRQAYHLIRAGRNSARGKTLRGRRIGYFLAHTGLVVIGLGALLDSDLPLKLKRQIEAPVGSTQALIPRLAADTLSFRGRLSIPEGTASSQAVLAVDDKILLQDLPFSVTLKKFRIDRYANGQPRRFVSEVELSDGRETISRTIEVGKPIEYRGIHLYQAGFEDGGSRLALRAYPLTSGTDRSFSGVVGESFLLEGSGYRSEVELTALTPPTTEEQPALRRGIKGFKATQGARLIRTSGSFEYTLRAPDGEGRKFSNTLVPVEEDGRKFLLSGMRGPDDERFRYLRIPADDQGSVDSFFALRLILLDPKQKDLLARRFAASTGSAKSRQKLETSARKTLELFQQQGFASLDRFIATHTSEPEHEHAAELFLQVLEGLAWQAATLARSPLPPLERTPAHAAYIRDALAAISDSFAYGAPVYLKVERYEQIHASVLMANRSPGNGWIATGATLLVLGVFAMCFLSERKRPSPDVQDLDTDSPSPGRTE